MTKTKGYRRGTRNKFKKNFREHGDHKISNYLRTFSLGEFVDIKVDGAIHRGMPYKFYHGRTGQIFDINKRSLGLIVKKKVRNREIVKKIYVRMEHVQKSNSAQEYRERRGKKLGKRKP